MMLCEESFEIVFILEARISIRDWQIASYIIYFKILK